jgi:hypothetical protein
MMHGHEKSDPAIVVMKPANKAEGPFAARPAGERHAAESVERRAGAKGNTHQQSTFWTLSQARVSKALERTRTLVPSSTQGPRPITLLPAYSRRNALYCESVIFIYFSGPSKKRNMIA